MSGVPAVARRLAAEQPAEPAEESVAPLRFPGGGLRCRRRVLSGWSRPERRRELSRWNRPGRWRVLSSRSRPGRRCRGRYGVGARGTCRSPGARRSRRGLPQLLVVAAQNGIRGRLLQPFAAPQRRGGLEMSTKHRILGTIANVHGWILPVCWLDMRCRRAVIAPRLRCPRQ